MFGKSYKDALSLLLYYIDDEYKKAHPDLPLLVKKKPDIWIKAMAIARENGLLYYFSQRLYGNRRKVDLPKELLINMIKDEERGFAKLRNTLLFLDSLFKSEEIDFIIIKLYRNIPYVPRDVDILIREDQINRLFSALKKNNITVSSFSKGVETQFQKEGLFKVDVYARLSYFSRNFLEERFIWSNPRFINICGIECPVLSYEADFLLLIIHSLLGHRYLSLLDFLYAKFLLNNKCLGFDKVLYQVKKYQWDFAFLTMIHEIKNIYQKLYLDMDAKVINFPYRFSTQFLLRVIESLKVNEKAKITFLLSTLIDQTYYQYLMAQRSIPLKISDRTKNWIMRIIHLVRSIEGDQKI